MAFLARLGLTLKSWLVAAAGFIAVVGVLAIAWLKQSRDEWKDKARRAEAQIEYDDAVDEADQEISAEYTDIRERDDKENLRDANDW